MKKITTGLTALIVFTLVASSVSAFDWYNNCSDTSTARKFMNFTSCNATACENYNITQNVPCINGCSNSIGGCRPDNFMSQIYAFGLLLGIIFIGILGFYVAQNYIPIVMMLLFSFIISVYFTDFFEGVTQYLLLVVSIAVLAMNIDAYIKYRKEEKEK